MKEFRFGDVRGTVVHFLPVTSGLDKTSVLQGAEMMGYSGAAHIHYRGDVGDAFLMVAEQPEDLEPGGVAELGHYVGDPSESFVVGKERPECTDILDVAVVVGESVAHNNPVMGGGYYKYCMRHTIKQLLNRLIEGD